MQLYSYQEYGVSWLINNGSPKPKHSLLGDDMGLGKTAQMIVACERLAANRILVLCPATIKINWMREFLKWSGYKKIFIIKTGKDKPPADAEVIIVNYDLIIRPSIKKQILNLKFKVGIMDEAHYLQSIKSQRTKAVLAKGGVIWNCEYKWAATGTFMPNRPKNIYALVRSLAPYAIEPFLDYNAFAFRYCGAYMGAFGIDDNGCSHPEELGDRLKPFMLRRLKEEVLAQLPEKTIQYIYLEHTPKVKEVLALEAELSEEELDAIYEFQDLGNKARLRRLIALAKIDQCVAHIKDQMLTLNKVGIGFYHREVLEVLKKELEEYGVCVVTGGMSGTQKQEQIDEFVNNPNKRIFLGQIQAAGVGVDGLQLVCSNVILVETSWVPGDIDQFIDRWRRIGQKNNVHVQVLVVPDSIEENIVYSELEKRKNIKSVMSRVETLVSSKDKEKENVEMSLENETKRCADALERIADVLEADLRNGQNMAAEQPIGLVPQLQAAGLPVVPVQNDCPNTEVNNTEKDALVAEAKALGIPGKVGAMSVDNLKKRIAEHKVAMQTVATPVMDAAAAAMNVHSANVAMQQAVNNAVPTQPVPQTATQATVPQQPVYTQPAAPAQPAAVNDAMIQKAAQDLVKKIGPQPATAFVQGVIHQIGGDVYDAATATTRPAKLTDINVEQKAAVLDFINAKIAEA